MKKLLLAAVLLSASSLALAGAANTSITRISGTSTSLTLSTGVSNVSEVAIGQRHLDASTGLNTSVRDETYLRSSVTSSGYSEASVGVSSVTGLIIDSTRIGEATFRSVGSSVTVGVATSSKATIERGRFTAYDSVGDSYSSEAGLYTATTLDTSVTGYLSSLSTSNYSQSAYAIYGAN